MHNQNMILAKMVTNYTQNRRQNIHRKIKKRTPKHSQSY